MCVGCGKCFRGCPLKAISMKDGKAKINHRKCIRCYSCHEFCDSHAILLKRSLRGKAMALLVERKK
jgi:formate hydrogenlyase subunit 6/NADH:ubiquinone oxidoreductase subunit I